MKTFKHTRITQLAMALAVALSATPVMAQNTSSAISGEVVGANSQPLAGATVTIKHLESGSVSTATTDASGRFSARGLRVGGPYTVTISKDGLTETRENVFLQLAETKYVDVTLGGQQVLDTATVTGVALGSEIFSADKMGTGTNISREQIDAYPSINRNIQDFARLDPRVVQTDKARNEISVSGQNPRYNAIRIDGVSISDTFGLESNNLPSPRQPMSMDTIEAIKVDVSSYDVTVTGGTGAVITAVTKSGTNELVGSVYGLYRENSWSGEGETGVRPDLFDTQTTYGFTVGGPILKDTLFFFANYEKYTGTDEFTGNSGFGPIGSNATNIVNVTQAQIDEIIDISKDVWGFDPGDLTLPSLDTETEEYGIKIDWNINENHRADFRYSKSEQNTPFLVGASSTSLSLSKYNYVRDFNLDTYSAQLFSDWTDSFSTEAKISYRDYSAVRSELIDLPAISIQIGSSFVNFGTEENTHTNILETQTWNGFFAGTWFVGDHQVKVGFDYEDNSVYNLFGRRTNGVYRFANIAAYEAGTPNRYQYFRPAGDDIDNMAADFGISDFGLFAMDTWAVNSNLTVNYGFRYDMYSVDSKPTYNATASNAFGYNNSETIDGESLFQPRVGFNYTFDSERPSQLRGGFGLFAGQSPTVWLANPYSNNGLSYTDYFISTGAGVTFVPDPDDQLSAFTPGNGATQSIDFIAPELAQPSAWKANIAFDYETPWYGIVLTTEYISTSVVDGIFYQQLNLGSANQTLTANGAAGVGQDGRLIYWNNAGLNPANFNQFGTASGGASARGNRNTAYNDAIIAQQTGRGGSDSFTVALSQPFNDNSWSWNVAYTYTYADEVSPLTSSTSSSNLGNVAVFQANEEVVARSSYAIQDRFTAAFNWKHNFWGDNQTLFTVYYEGRSGKPYSYTFDNDANGDGRTNDLLYIPLDPNDVRFGSQAESDAFWAFVNSTPYLRNNLGKVAERNAVEAGFVNTFDVKISQQFPGFMKGHESEIWLDIMNIGNMFNDSWGVIDQMPFPGMRGVVEYGGICGTTVTAVCTAGSAGKYVYRFNTPDKLEVYDDKGISRWALQIGFRYNF